MNNQIYLLLLGVVVIALTTGVYQKTQQSHIQYAHARQLSAKGDYVHAITYYEKSLKANPNNINVLIDAASCYQSLSRFPEATVLLNKALSLGPKNDKVRLSLAQTLAWQKDYAASVVMYQDLLTRSDDISLRKELADVYSWNKQFDEAYVLLKKMRDEDPKDIDLKWRMVILFHDSGKIDEEGYETLLKETQGHNWKSTEYLAEFYVHKGSYDKALEYYQNILKSDPQNIQAQIHIAEVLSWQKKYPQAIEIYRNLLKQSNDLNLQKQLVDVYSWNKQFDEAYVLIKELRNAHPDDADLKWRTAVLLHDSGKIDETGYENLLKEVQGLHKEAIEYLAELYIHNGTYDRALSSYQDILKSDPSNKQAKAFIADILSWQKKYPDAIKLYEELLADSPNDTAIQEKLAQVYTWNKDYEKAEKIYRILIEKQPDQKKYYTSLGEMLIWDKRYSDARVVLEKAITLGEDKDVSILYGEAVFWSGDPLKAKEIFADILRKYPANKDLALQLADLQAYSKDFEPAIDAYQGALKESPHDVVILEKLADIYTWKKDYKKSIAIYDEILCQKEDKKIRLKKARIYSWTKKYALSLKEYQKILTYDHDSLVALEKDAKLAYWNNNVKKAISSYQKLFAQDPDNREAIFDLSQIYAWHSMWPQAKEQFNFILKVLPDDPLAKQGLEKVELLSKHVSLTSGYEFFDGHSQTRDSDIRRHSWNNNLLIPINDHMVGEIDEADTWRSFKDYPNISEQATKLKLSYVNQPDWWVQGFYQLYTYGRGIDSLSTFGASLGNQIGDDIAISNFSFERARLENSSSVIRNNKYADQIKERLDFDFSPRFKAGLDYQFSNYSDGNRKNEPAGDIQYLLSFDPDRVSIKYRLDYTDFNHTANDYFSPKNFYANTWGIAWRHYFNKDGIFFGSKDIYSELGYDVTFDSLRTTGNHYYTELIWDVTKRLQLNLKGSLTNCNPDVYEDKNVTVSAKYYF